MQGVSVRPSDTGLTTRAADFLASGPAAAAQLIEYVCRIPGAPAVVAEHLAATLFAGRREFSRAADGRWHLVAPMRAPYAYSRKDQRLAPAATLASLSYVVVDVETTGGQHGMGDRITEVAAVVVRDGNIVEIFETLVNPERSIPPFISRLTNINWEMVRDKPTFRDVCPDLLRVMRGHVFVAHNATFDWRFLGSEVARATGEQLTGPRLCTVKLARKMLPQLPRRSLDWCARHYGVEITARHRAGGDAVATAHVLIGLLRDAARRGCTTWVELQEILGARTAKRKRRRWSALPGPVERDTTA